MPRDDRSARLRGLAARPRRRLRSRPDAFPGRALVANLDVFLAAEFDPRAHDVRSWAWTDGAEPSAVLSRLEREATAALATVPDGPRIASGYVRGKRVLSTDRRAPAIRALPWLVGELRRADRVLVGVPPSGGRDRVLWAALVVLAVLTRRPLAFYSETWLSPAGRKHTAHRVLDRVLATLATTILVPGRQQAHHYERLGRGAKVRRIGSPYAPEPGAVVARRTSTPPVLLFVGRAMPLKGLDRLLDLVARLDADGRRIRLVALLHDPGNQFGGRDAGYAARCAARLRARDPDLTEVHEERVDVGAFHARATLLVVPNRILPYDKVPGESWGRIVPEALAAGLPVVSSDAVPSAVEYVVDGQNGAVVPWDDDAALAAAVRDWLPR